MSEASSATAFRCVNPRCYRFRQQVTASARQPVCRWTEECERFAAPTSPPVLPPPLSARKPRSKGKSPVKSWAAGLLGLAVLGILVSRSRRSEDQAARAPDPVVPSPAVASPPPQTRPDPTRPPPAPTFARGGDSSLVFPVLTTPASPSYPPVFTLPPTQGFAASRYVAFRHPRGEYTVQLPIEWTRWLKVEDGGDRVSASEGHNSLLLRVRVDNRRLEAIYDEWATPHTRKDPEKQVDYKVMRKEKNWFVVSGASDNGRTRGYYVKGYLHNGKILLLCLEYDENNVTTPTEDTIKQMSRSFPGL